jgi:CheY-like chemotaxis protein
MHRFSDTFVDVNEMLGIPLAVFAFPLIVETTGAMPSGNVSGRFEIARPRTSSGASSVPMTWSQVMESSGAGSSFRVLYVDDNRDLADSAVLLLRITGFEAVACYDGQTAIQLAETYRPDICILDLQMPNIDGFDVAMRLRAEPWCPSLLVAITAMSDDLSRSRTTLAGFDIHLIKPVDPLKFVALVDAFCRTASVPENIEAFSEIEWHAVKLSLQNKHRKLKR